MGASEYVIVSPCSVPASQWRQRRVITDGIASPAGASPGICGNVLAGSQKVGAGDTAFAGFCSGLPQIPRLKLHRN
jgi:hypothetical protein